MLCSMSTGGKTGPSWLDRLRSAKGFPASTDGDLEHFLNRNPSAGTGKNELESSSGSVPLDKKRIVCANKSEVMSNDHQNGRKDEEWFDIMSTVLAELFVMGDPTDSTRIRKIGEAKSSRKQQNPRFCEFSASASVDDFISNGAQRSDGIPAMSPSSADNSVAGVKETPADVVLGLKTKKKKKKKKNGISCIDAGAGEGAGCTEEEEEEEESFEANRYTRVDVTIIDTSATVWKSEKVIFRKGSVWKVRDRKSKCRRISSLRKKRKASHFDEDIGGKKKKKKKKQKLPPEVVKNTGEDIVSLIDGFPGTEKGKSSKLNPGNLNQVPKTRQIFSRSPRKPAKSNSFHIQSVPSSKKIWGTPSKKQS